MEPALSKMLLTSVDLRWNPQNIVPSRNSDHGGALLTLLALLVLLYIGVVTRS